MVALFCCFKGSWKINRRKRSGGKGWVEKERQKRSGRKGSVEKERWKKNYRDYNRIDKYSLETQRVPL